MSIQKTTCLEMTVTALQQRWGWKALYKPNSVAARIVPHISTGFASLDAALGIGGLARGRVSELVGPASSGKTTLALQFLSQAQANGAAVGYVDQARSFDPEYAHHCGLDLTRLFIAAPYDLQETLAITEALAGSGELTALAVDSLETLWEDAAGSQQLAACLDRLVALLSHSATVLLFLHAPQIHGSPASYALAHHATTRLCVVSEQWLRRHGDTYGYKAQIEVQKNRLGPAGQLINLAIEFNSPMHGSSI